MKTKTAASTTRHRHSIRVNGGGGVTANTCLLLPAKRILKHRHFPMRDGQPNHEGGATCMHSKADDIFSNISSKSWHQRHHHRPFIRLLPPLSFFSLFSYFLCLLLRPPDIATQSELRRRRRQRLGRRRSEKELLYSTNSSSSSSVDNIKVEKKNVAAISAKTNPTSTTFRLVFDRCSSSCPISSSAAA